MIQIIGDREYRDCKLNQISNILCYSGCSFACCCAVMLAVFELMTMNVFFKVFTPKLLNISSRYSSLEFFNLINNDFNYILVNTRDIPFSEKETTGEDLGIIYTQQEIREFYHKVWKPGYDQYRQQL